jgi:hypothetical protein
MATTKTDKKARQHVSGRAVSESREQAGIDVRVIDNLVQFSNNSNRCVIHK